MLEKEFKVERVYKVHPKFTVARNQKPGSNPSTDEAITRTVTVIAHYLPRILYEYKPVVQSNLQSLEASHLMEGLVQAFYAARYYKQHKIVFCITDLYHWHYFMCSYCSYSCKLKVEWNHTVRMPEGEVSPETMSVHVQFVLSSMKELEE